MSAPENALPNEGRIFDVVQRAYRTRVYRPARYYLTWYFLASVLSMLLFMTAAVYVFLDSGFDLFEQRIAFYVAGFLASLFLAVLSTYNGMIASSLHLVLGDRGIFSLGSTPATAPIVTKSTFICATPEQKALYPVEVHGCRVTRYMVWRWGRKGGCKNWPGKQGGKAEGFWAVVVYAWEEAEQLNADGSSTGRFKVLDRQPCPTCNRDDQTEKERKDWLGFVHVPALSAEDLQRMAQDTPGLKRGGVIDLRVQINADRYLEEVPFAIADAIQHDEEFRASSRVDVGYDPLPEGNSLGMVMSHNAEIQLFGLEHSGKRMRKQIVDLNQTIAVVNQLKGGLGGSGGGI